MCIMTKRTRKIEDDGNEIIDDLAEVDDLIGDVIGEEKAK